MTIKTIKSASKGLSTQLTSSSRIYQKASRVLRRTIKHLPSERPYNITVSTESRFIWFRVAKVGTRTIADLLHNSGLTLSAEHPYDCYYPETLWRDYYKFAFVRNPWDRVVSCWCNKVVESNYFGFSPLDREKMTVFSNFVEYLNTQDLRRCDAHLRLQSSLVDLNNLDFLGRFETFSEDVTLLKKTLGLEESFVVKKLNSTKKQAGYRSHYNEYTATLVGKLYSRDAQIFNYSF